MNGASDVCPRGEQLTLGQKIADEYAQEAKRLRAKLRKALTSNGRSLADAAKHLQVDESFLTRMLDGRANIAAEVLIFAAWWDETGEFARYHAALAHGEFNPKPPPGPEHWFPLVKEELARRGLWDLIADSIGYPRRPTPMPGEEG